MTILDRHIAARFLANFLLLFALLFVFAVSIDIILQLDVFTKAAREIGGRGLAYWVALIRVVLDYHGPRVFQFYAYMLGLVSVGAAGFTLTQMVKTRELVAIMSAGVSLMRVALVLIAVATLLNVLQLINQEVMLPRLAPLLVRGHEDILKSGLEGFEVPLSRDGGGQLLRAKWMDTGSGELSGLLLLERDEKGVQIARVEAERARWDSERGRYLLTGGQRFVRRLGMESLDDAIATGQGAAEGGVGIEEVRAVDSVATDLSPRALVIRRYEQFAQMLSLRQLREMREEGGVSPTLLSRLTYLRLGGIAVNLLVLAAALPFFLLREPVSMLQQSIRCAAFAIPATLGSFVAMTLDLPALAPAVAVFLPAAILVPIALGRLGAMRT